MIQSQTLAARLAIVGVSLSILIFTATFTLSNWFYTNKKSKVLNKSKNNFTFF